MSTDRQSSLVKITELENGIFKIILSDPSHQNTLSEKMIDELQSAFDHFNSVLVGLSFYPLQEKFSQLVMI